VKNVNNCEHLAALVREPKRSIYIFQILIEKKTKKKHSNRTVVLLTKKSFKEANCYFI
jgi:hypothetical protein